MDLRAQSAFLAALTAAALAVAVALRAGERRIAVLFAVLAGNLAVWHLSDFLLAVSGSPHALRLMVASAVALPGTLHRFFEGFIASQAASLEGEGGHAPHARRLSGSLWLGAAAGAVLALTPLIRQPAFLWIVAAYVFGAIAFVLYDVHLRGAAARSRIERRRLTYVVSGGAFATLLALSGFIPVGETVLAALRNLGVVLYLYFLSQTILKHRLLDLNELLGKILVLGALALLLGVVYALIVAAVGDDKGLLVFNVLLVSFVLMTLFEPLRSRVENRVMAWLFAERHELMAALERLRRELPGIIDVGSCAVRILDRLYETNRVTHASFYLLSEDGTGYRVVAARGPDPAHWMDAATLRPVIASAASGQKAILLETVERRLHESRRLTAAPATPGHESPSEPDEVVRLRELRAALSRMHAGVTVPLVSAGRVLGLLNLQDERVYEAYATDEIAAIILVADLAATVVENSRLYEQMKERDRLAALGEMSAGLAHEIRNPLGAIKAAAQYLDPASLDGDEGEFLQIIVEEVDRLNGVVSQFLDYARPLKGHFAPTDLNDVVRRTLRLLEHGDLPDGVEIRTHLSEALPAVDADPEQLKQVLINLTLNAVQAMQGSGRLEIRTGRQFPEELEEQGETGPGFVELRVRDTGPGLTEEVRQSLFIPFFTTKEKGTGLGLPICQRIVRNHQGSLEVHSRPGEGAEFVVRLPASVASVRRQLDRPPGHDDAGQVVPFRR